MNVEFTWNEMTFRVVCFWDGHPDDGGDFVVDKLFLTDGKSEVCAMGLFLCDAISDRLENLAFESYLKACAYERDNP